MTKKDNSFNIYTAFHNYNIYFPTRTIYFGGSNFFDDNDVVSSCTVSEVIKNLHILECEKIAPISMLLNTVGGSWDDGIAVYDLIKSLKSPVTIIGIGKVYSMGSLILQAGTTRVITKNTHILIHQGSDGYIGSAKNFERWAENSKEIRKVMYQIYYERIKEVNSKITLKDIETICDFDTIYNSEQSKKMGLIDEII